jgi:branched-chain amino acid transport system substrate-binding protein
MDRSFRTLILVAAIAVSVLVSGGFRTGLCAPADSKEPIKIGLLSSLSGNLAAIKPWWEPTVNMVVNNVNASGGLLGRRVQLILKDDQGDPSLVAQRLTELKSEGVVAILGPFWGANGKPTQQWAETNNIPVISFADPQTISRVNYNKYIFWTLPASDAVTEAIYRGILSKPVKSIYNIGVDVVNPHDQYNWIWGKMKKEHPEVINLGEIWVGGRDMEFSNIISAALAKKPDVINAGIAGPAWAALVQQGQKFNLFQKTRVVGQYILGAEVSTPFGKNYPEGIESAVWCPFWDTSNKAMQDYVQAHLKAAKVYPADKGMEFHLAALAAVAGIKKAGSTDPDAIVKALETVTFDSPIGPIHFDDYDHQANIPIWWATSTQSPNYPIAIGTKMIKYGTDLYPTKEEIMALRAAKK